MATLRKAGAGSLRGGRGCDDDAPRGGARRRSVPRVALAAAALMMLAGAGVGTALHACSDLAWHSVTVFSLRNAVLQRRCSPIQVGSVCCWGSGPGAAVLGTLDTLSDRPGSL